MTLQSRDLPARSRSLEPGELSSTRSPTRSRVSFRVKGKDDSHLAQMIAEGFANANGTFTGGHGSAAGVHVVRHDLVTPKSFRKERPICSNVRRCSTVSTDTIMGASAAGENAVRLHKEMTQDSRPQSRDNTPINPYVYVSLGRTTNANWDNTFQLDYVDASVKMPQHRTGSTVRDVRDSEGPRITGVASVEAHQRRVGSRVSNLESFIET